MTEPATTAGAWLRARPASAGFAAGALLVAAIALALRPPAAPPAPRAATERIVHDYLLAHPEVIFDAVGGMQSSAVTKLLADNRAEIETPFAGAFAGDPKGDVVLVEFFDYACPYCRAANADVARLLAADKHLKLVYRDFPVLSPESAEVALASLSAALQGRYVVFHDRMFASGPPTREHMVAVVRAAGLDEKRTAADLGSPALKAQIKKNLDLGRALGLHGTPSFIVGGKILSGAVGYEALKSAVDDARSRR